MTKAGGMKLSPVMYEEKTYSDGYGGTTENRETNPFRAVSYVISSGQSYRTPYSVGIRTQWADTG